MPMPGDAAVGPATARLAHRADGGHRFVEVPPHQRGDRGERFAGLAAGRAHLDLVAGRHAEGGQCADAAAAHRGTVGGEVADADVGVEAADGFDETGRRTGVQAVFVVQGELDAGDREPAASPCVRRRGSRRCRAAWS